MGAGTFDTGEVLTDVNASNSQLNDEMRKTANELLDSMQDSRFSETEVRLKVLQFLNIFRAIEKGEIIFRSMRLSHTNFVHIFEAVN